MAIHGKRPGKKVGKKSRPRTKRRMHASRSSHSPRVWRRRRRIHTEPTDPTHQRLQKVLAAAGVDSRRNCEELILSGVVEVNGETVDTLPVFDGLAAAGGRLLLATTDGRVLCFTKR